MSKAQSEMNLEATLQYVTRTNAEDLGDPAYYCAKIGLYICQILSLA